MRICKYILSLLLVITIPIGLITCDNYEFPKSPYPRIETLVVTDITENGVTFQANLIQLGNQPITNHGFVWGITENVSIGSEDKVQLGAQSNTGKFEAIVKSGLEKDVTYFVKAFVATNDYFVYGKAIEFTSKGSTLPIIESILPTEGTWGDTILLKGNYFSAKVNVNKVKFGNRESTVIFSNDSIIKCIVPNDISDKTVQIDLEVAGNKSNSEVVFTLLTPLIESFTPSSGTFDDIVTIGGSNFNKIKERNFVSFNGKPAEVIEASVNQLKVRVPRTITTKENQISVTVNLQSAIAASQFDIVAPNIISLSTSEAFIGSTIEISGINFNPVPKGNRVLFGNNEALVTDASKTLLKVTIPQGIYDQRTFKINVIVAENSVESYESLTLQNPWLKRSTMNPVEERDGGVTFSINGKAYLGLGSKFGLLYKSFWEYDPSISKWEKMPDFPGNLGVTIFFTIGECGYVGGGFDPYSLDPLYDFWKFNSITKTWSKVGDIPTKMIGGSESISNGEKGYVLLEGATDNFWEYNPINDQWKSKAVFNGHPYHMGAFAINNRLYFHSSDASTGPNHLNKYDIQSDSWGPITEIDNFSFEDIAFGFMLNNNGYLILSGLLYKYNPTTDSLVILMENPPYGFTFGVNNKAYAWSGTQLWEFDPLYE